MKATIESLQHAYTRLDMAIDVLDDFNIPREVRDWLETPLDQLRNIRYLVKSEIWVKTDKVKKEGEE